MRTKTRLEISPDRFILEELEHFGVRNFTSFFEQKAQEFIKECKVRRLEVQENLNFVQMLCTCGAIYTSKLNNCPGCSTSKAHAKVFREEFAKN